MKLQDTETLRRMEKAKLIEELNLSLKELFKVQYDVKNGQSKSAHLIGRYKKYIAKLKTLLTEKSNQIVDEK